MVEQGDIPESMGSCLDSFPNINDYQAGDLVDFQILSPAQAEVVGEIDIDDDKATEETRFVVVQIEARLANKIKMKLENPNGIYCIDVKSEMVNKIKIRAHCSAEVLHTAVNAGMINDFDYDVSNEEECNPASENEVETLPENSEEVVNETPEDGSAEIPPAE